MIRVADYVDELAPRVVVRAARFPLRALRTLADTGLATAVQQADEAGIGGDELQRRYEDAIAQEREILYRLTVGDAAFSRALCITNQELSRRLLDDAHPRGRRNKRARHLETTLYRYLARAVWRTAPCDLWTGVGLASWGERTEVAPAGDNVAFAPDLRPYQAIVSALAASPRYADVGLFRLNPTLVFEHDRRCWTFTTRTLSAQLLNHERPSHPGLDLVLRFFEGRAPASLADLAQALARCPEIAPGDGRENACGILMILRAGGLLVGGLTFPARFSSAWQALVSVARDLPPDHAHLWRSSVRRLRRLCRALERDLPSLALGELHQRLDQARRVPTELAAALGVPLPALPRSILRADCGLPHAFVFGPEMKAAVAQAIAEHEAYERGQGVDAAVRAAHRRYVLRGDRPRPEPGADNTPAATGLPTLEWAWRKGGADPLLGARLCHWAAHVQADDGACIDARVDVRVIDPAERIGDLRSAPIAGVLLRPARQGFTVVGSTTEVVAAYGRYGALWYGLGSPGDARMARDPLNRWYIETLTAVARQAGVEIVEHVGPCEQAPNGLARPRFGLPTWDVWGSGSSPGAPLRLADVTIATRPPHDVPLAFRAGSARPMALTCWSPMNVGYGDRALERLLLSSFREIPTWIWPGLPLACEARAIRRSPRLELPSGHAVQARRTFITGDTLAALVKADPLGRFRIWQALARRLCWPELVVVTRDAGAPILVVRDSPLALEAVLEGMREGVTLLSVEEPDDHAWLVDDNGEAFISELIVPFLRRGHAWTDLDAGQCPNDTADTADPAIRSHAGDEHAGAA